jgi:hypothetical protein
MATAAMQPTALNQHGLIGELKSEEHDLEELNYYNNNANNNNIGNINQNVYIGANNNESLISHLNALKKAKKVTFYKNGDKYFNGKHVTIKPSRYFSLKELMDDLSRSVDLPYGVRRLYTPVNGTEIFDIDDINDGFSYVSTGGSN